MLGVLGLVMDRVSISTDYGYVCENTGSRYGYRVWWNGARARDWYRVSPLEEFMKAEFPGVLKHRWTSYNGTGKNFYGSSISFGHGAPGAALNLKDETARAWIAHHTKQEVRALYDTLASGDRDAADAIVKLINAGVATSRE